jgi:signal transduction histidine kinase
MQNQLRRYALALVPVLIAALARYTLVPLLGYRYGFTVFLVSTFVAGRYLGFGPSVFALLAGCVPATALHYMHPSQSGFDSRFQTALYVYLVLGAIVVLLCRSEHRVRAALHREIAERTAEQELLRHTIEFQDHERQLIAYEIHDGLVQYAAGALMQLEALQDHAPSKAVAEQIEPVMGILQKAVAEGRRLINGIRTPVLDDWGVVAAVEQLIEEEDRAHVQIEFVKNEALGRMPPSIEEALYRITQEALTNIRKHSDTKKIRVELARQGDRVRLEVRDWGVGFVPTNGSTAVHGLRGIRNRARIAGGQCKIESTPGKGTQIVVELPYVSKG